MEETKNKEPGLEAYGISNPSFSVEGHSYTRWWKEIPSSPSLRIAQTDIEGFVAELKKDIEIKNATARPEDRVDLSGHIDMQKLVDINNQQLDSALLEQY